MEYDGTAVFYYMDRGVQMKASVKLPSSEIMSALEAVKEVSAELADLGTAAN